MTQRSLLDALEASYPMLRGTIRDHTTKKRRALVRFFACGEDLSNEPLDAPLPERSRPVPSRTSSSGRWRAARDPLPPTPPPCAGEGSKTGEQGEGRVVRRTVTFLERQNGSG